MPDLATTLWYSVSAVGLLEAARKWQVNRRITHALSRSYLSAGLALMATSLAVGAKPTMTWAARLTGLPNLAFLLQGGLAMAAMVCVAGFLRALDWLHLRVRAVACLTGCCYVVMAVLCTVFGGSDLAFGAASDPMPTSHVYSLIYLTYMVTWLTVFMRGLWVTSAREERAIRGAVWLACLGMSVVMLAMIWRLLLHARGLAAGGAVGTGTHLGAVADGIGMLLFVLSSVFAGAVRSWRDRADRARMSSDLAAVRRLWQMLAPVRGTGSLAGIRGMPEVGQQVIDIFDARLILRRFVGPDLDSATVTVMRDLHIEDRWTDRLATAVEMVLGLHRYRRSCAHDHQPAPPGTDHDVWPEDSAVHVDDDRRIGWLADVARLAETSCVFAIVRRLEPVAANPICRSAPC